MLRFVRIIIGVLLFNELLLFIEVTVDLSLSLPS